MHRLDEICPKNLVTSLHISKINWAKVYLENNHFFQVFNQLYYDEVIRDSSAKVNLPLLVNLARKSTLQVEGKDFRTWYSQQAILNGAPLGGELLYQRPKDYVIDFFTRNPNGSEKMIGDQTVTWEVYDHRGSLLDHGSCLTQSEFGWCSYTPILNGYFGRLELVAQAQTSNDPVSNIIYRYSGDELGVFGVVDSALEGIITITLLTDPLVSETTSVMNSAFYASSLEELRGRFKAVFISSTGKTITRYFNKDAGKYFLLVSNRQSRIMNGVLSYTSRSIRRESALSVNLAQSVPTTLFGQDPE